MKTSDFQLNYPGDEYQVPLRQPNTKTNTDLDLLTMAWYGKLFQ